ncbi:DUF3592 domain-containing protein [Aestuariibius sp. 2305UL40-4]|uniref:DUF3592 domain-containing protein n=1 Tax=Aestuariibius violaceus TaxID=3234132 RepID=UPI00345F08D4
MQPLNADALYAALAIAIGVAGVTAGLLKLLRVRNILFHKATATGTIVATRLKALHRYDEEAEAHLTIRFETPQGPVEFREMAPSPFWRRHTPGSVRAMEGRPIKVAYDSRDPRRASTDLTGHVFVGAFYVAVGAMFLSGVATHIKEVGGVRSMPLYQVVQDWLVR